MPIRRRGDEGSSAVEFALVSVVLTLFLVGTLQFGMTFSQWLQVVHAAREGARWASMREGASVVQGRVVAASAPLTPKSITITPGNYTDASQIGKPVTVTVTYDSVVIAPLFDSILHASGVKQLSSSATLRVE